MILGAMQPYLFPYIGYYQLMKCVDTYLFCGGFQYMRHGWVNRNRIFINHKKQEINYFTFSVAKDDFHKKINQRRYCNLKEDCEKLLRCLHQNYRHASNFEEAYCIIKEAVTFSDDNIARFNMNANLVIAKYLEIQTKIICMDTIEDHAFWDNFYRMDRESRVVYFCNYFGANCYINAIGGISLYREGPFLDKNIELGFLKTDDITYPQLGYKFVPNLSIIDILMNNKLNETKVLLDKYQIVKPYLSGS